MLASPLPWRHSPNSLNIYWGEYSIMERRNKEKVTFESHGTKHESNRIAFSLMSYGLESSRAFIPQTFARCWWQLGECWVSCVVMDERKRERHKDRIPSQVARSVTCIFLEPTRHTESTVTPLFSSDTGILSRLHICHFLHVPLSP